MLRRNMLFGGLLPIKSATCLFGVNSIEWEIHHVHYLWECARECADNNPILLVQTVCRLGCVRADRLSSNDFQVRQSLSPRI